jgi:hypothetical protein
VGRVGLGRLPDTRQKRIAKGKYTSINNKMGNKQAVQADVASTEVLLRPRCVHRGCMTTSYGGGVMCLDHMKEAKRKQLEEVELKSNTKKNGTVSKHP